MSEEVKLDKKTMIVSETDSKGIIIYANADFYSIAGYTKWTTRKTTKCS